MNEVQKNSQNNQDVSPSISRIPAFDDNYIWFIHGLTEKQAEQQIIIVDPGDAEPVLKAIETHKYLPQAIFITHHHGDHTGGISKLVKQYKIPVYGPQNEQIPHLTHALSEKQTVSIDSMGLSFEVLDVPGHTIGHIAYSGHRALFIGDTLFAGGCGRIFEGTAEQMHQSLSKLLTLAADTLIYCAHEYTQDNLAFANRVEPENTILAQRIQDTLKMRAINKATVPSTLELEMKTNPFLRFDTDSVRTAAETFAQQALNTPADVFRVTRHWKDTLD